MDGGVRDEVIVSDPISSVGNSGPATQIIGFQGPKPLILKYLGPKAL